MTGFTEDFAAVFDPWILGDGWDRLCPRPGHPFSIENEISVLGGDLNHKVGDSNLK
jgi:hypothetical protein